MKSTRQPSQRHSRKGKEKKEKEVDKDELREKLKQKLREKKLERTCWEVRDKKMETLKRKLKECTDPREKIKIQEEIDLLETIETKLEDRFAGEYPEYVDTCSYGGQLEHPE